MKYQKTPLITNTEQLAQLQCGQWVQFEWCDKPSRFHQYKGPHYTRAFHWPYTRGFETFCALSKKKV